jgi:small subunit ribosomal protein S4
MKIGPKYKIARRLGSAVFEKTSTPKYALHAEKKGANMDGVRPRSNYGIQLLAKQKIRYTYGLTAKQLANYIRKVIESKTRKPEAMLYSILERRLDRAVLRSGLAKTQRQARQMVSHGHVRVNDKKITVPSYEVKIGDKVAVKDSSKEKGLFSNIDEQLKEANIANWIKVDAKTLSFTVEGEPQYKSIEVPFNIGEAIQFYKR